MRGLSSLGIVKAQSISSNDVTEQYVNLRAQLDSYTTEEAALLRILNSSATVRDALDTENAIQNTEAQINDLEGQLREMQRLVAFATINVELIQSARTPMLDFGAALNSALQAFYTVTSGILILGASLIPIAIIGGVVYVPYRHLSRKKPKSIEAK
jgi:Tfp pilus assembly protein FimV